MSFDGFVFLLWKIVLWGFKFIKIVTFYSTCFLLEQLYKIFFFWKEFIKRGRSDFWTNATIGRIFNSWFSLTTFSYFFFFRSYASKLFNTLLFSEAFKKLNIFFFFEHISIEQMLFLFWLIFFLTLFSYILFIF